MIALSIDRLPWSERGPVLVWKGTSLEIYRDSCVNMNPHALTWTPHAAACTSRMELTHHKGKVSPPGLKSDGRNYNHVIQHHCPLRGGSYEIANMQVSTKTIGVSSHHLVAIWLIWWPWIFSNRPLKEGLPTVRVHGIDSRTGGNIWLLICSGINSKKIGIPVRRWSNHSPLTNPMRKHTTAIATGDSSCNTA